MPSLSGSAHAEVDAVSPQTVLAEESTSPVDSQKAVSMLLMAHKLLQGGPPKKIQIGFFFP